MLGEGKDYTRYVVVQAILLLAKRNTRVIIGKRSVVTTSFAVKRPVVGESILRLNNFDVAAVGMLQI